MRKVLLLVLIMGLWAPGSPAQTVIDTFAVTAYGDTAQFQLRIPVNYSPQNPPAIMAWWHGYGGSKVELGNTAFAAELATRGWIGACHSGPNSSHYNSRLGQEHCRAMLDFVRDNYPFSMDSIYMCGSSMGGASAQIWHNNNCGIHDYLLAGAAGGSPILDTQYRQEQYLALGQTNNAMIREFGGLPADCAAVAFQYHRHSAIFAADTSQSNHFNALNLPVYDTWGADSTEGANYGHIALILDSLRRAAGADTTLTFPSELAGHGYPIMHADSTCNWLSNFAANRYPDTLSINADESDEYYWTQVTLADTHHVWGRYGAVKDAHRHGLDIQLVRNIAQIAVEFAFPWEDFDSLEGDWANLDTANVRDAEVLLCGVPEVLSVTAGDTIVVPFTWNHDTLRVTIAVVQHYKVVFGIDSTDTSSTRGPVAAVPLITRLTAAYPNPFNAQISLDIESRGAGRQEIRLYDIMGRVAKSLSVGLRPGLQRVTVNASELASGVYFVTLPGAAQTPVKIMLLR